MDAFEKATAYLNIKPHTEKEVLNYLIRKGFEHDEAKEAVSRLREYRYIDDRAYARMYFEYGFEKGRGYSRISRELADKGVSRDIIEQAYEELEDKPDEYEMAFAIAEQIVGEANLSVGECSYKDKQKLQARIVRRLASRGFSGSVCYSVAREAVK